MARKIRWLSIGVLVTLGLGGTLYYFWRQATELPAWYVDQPNRLDPVKTQADAAAIEQKIKAQLKAQPENNPKNNGQGNTNPLSAEVQLSSAELNQLVTAKVMERTNKSAAAQAIRGIDTQIEDDRLKTGAVIDLADIKASEGSRETTMIQQVTEKFPAIANRKIYIGLEGKPQVVNGRLQFDANTNVQIGQLRFTLPELANRLGIPEATLLEKINLNLPASDLTLKEIELREGDAVLRGTAN
jgi:hypothetical protein